MAEEKESPDALLAFLAGAAAGVVAALLLAPGPGRDTRRRLKRFLGGLFEDGIAPGKSRHRD